MAKTGQIQLDGGAFGDLPLSDAVVFTESTPTSLGGVVSDLLDKSDAGLKIIIDVPDRKVIAFDLATDISTKLTLGDGKLIGTITRDDPTKKSSPVTMAAGDDVSAIDDLNAFKTAINGAFVAQKPSKNVSSIVNAVEDALAALAKQEPPITSVTQVAVVVDQTGDGSVKVYALVDSIGNAGALAKVKQVMQTDADVTTLAFE